jgi:RNA polymerase-binding transcription factor
VDGVTDIDRARHLDAVEADLADVELALARLEAGTYETCEVCSGPLGDDVLAVTPAARRCPACAH